MQLRAYQSEAIDAIYHYLRTQNGNPCCVLPTGSGKTPVLAAVCKDVVKKWHGRVLILAHVKELLEQARDKLSQFCSDIPIGLYSAGLGEKTSDGPVIVAGIQSVYRKASELGKFDLIIVDECHLLPEEGDGMYRQFLADMSKSNPAVRLIGLTATPYRMSSGWLCGPDHVLNEVCYEIGVKELIAQGYLCPLITKGSRRNQDYSALHVHAGEFVSSEVETLINTESNVYASCREFVDQSRDRNKVLIFAGSVAHAQNVQKMLTQVTGTECGLVTGSTSSADRDVLIRRFKWDNALTDMFGDPLPPLKYLVNVNVLTTGFDVQQIDCVVLLRPTASPGLYQQMVGRGLRLHSSKRDCLILDYGGNILRHGPIDAIRVREKSQHRTGEAPAKQCPECQMIMHAGYTACPGCGYTFPAREQGGIDARASEENVVSCDESNEYEIEDVFYAVHTKAGADEFAPKTMRVDYKIGWNRFQSEWQCVEHQGWARKRFEAWWTQRSKAPLPKSAYEAVQLANAGMLAKPQRITVTRKAGEKFAHVVDYLLGPIPEFVPFPTSLESGTGHACGSCVHFADGWCGAVCRRGLLSDNPACDQFLDKEDIPF